MNKIKFSIINRGISFGNAVRGLKSVYKMEQNFRIHLFVMAIAVLLGLYFSVSALEWCLLMFTFGFVLSMEIVNSAIERIGDYLNVNHDKQIGQIKDISAGAVLVASITAAAVGFSIFIPKIFW